MFKNTLILALVLLAGVQYRILGEAEQAIADRDMALTITGGTVRQLDSELKYCVAKNKACVDMLEELINTPAACPTILK